MVTRLKNNFEYIKYIRRKIKDAFPLWKEFLCEYEELPNCAFEIAYKYNSIDIEFIKHKSDFELRIYKNNTYPSNFSWENDIHKRIVDSIPDMDREWYCTPCVELVDFYINFLKERFDTFVWED
jgi:hypothetical protein